MNVDITKSRADNVTYFITKSQRPWSSTSWDGGVESIQLLRSLSEKRLWISVNAVPLIGFEIMHNEKSSAKCSVNAIAQTHTSC